MWHFFWAPLVLVWDGDDAITALQRQLETLVTKHKEADPGLFLRPKGTHPPGEGVPNPAACPPLFFTSFGTPARIDPI